MNRLSGKKYQLLALGVVVLMLGGVLLLQHWDPPRNRYHQHREARPYTACTDHGPEVFCTHLPLLSITTDEPVPDPFFYDENGAVLRNKFHVRLNNSNFAPLKSQLLSRN